MTYQFIDGYGSVLTADSSIVSGSGVSGTQRPIVNIGSMLSAIPTTFSGAPSISGAVTVVGTPSISGGVTIVGNASVSGTVGASAIGTTPVTQAGAWSTSLVGVIPGSVVAFQGGNWTTSLVSTIPSSVIVGASLFGQLPAGTAVLGSIAALQGTNPWATTTVGSIITLSQVPSIVGTYSDDAAHAVGGTKGIFTLGVRHDTLSSVTSADGDYSHHTVGPSGETIVADAPFTKWVSGVADLRVVLGASVTAIAAQGASVFTYVREVQVANFGSASVLVKIAGGLGSTLGWTIAPAGGGSNFTTRYKTGENSAVTASINGTASVLVTISGFTAKI